MGTQGLFRDRGVFGRLGATRDGVHVGFGWSALIATSLGLAVAGCSSSSPFSSQPSNSNPSQAAAAPPANYSVAAGQPGYAPPPGQQAYAPPAQPAYPPRPGPQAYAPAPGQQAYAPPPGQQAYPPPAGQQAYAQPQAAPQQEGTTTGSLRQGYVSFLKMFRDPDPDANPQPGSDARAANYAPPPPPQQNYAPPPAQPNYTTPAGQQGFGSRPGPQSYAAPPAPPPRSAYTAPPPAPTTAAAAPPASQDYTDLMPYPKQTLGDFFRGSSSGTQAQTSAQTMPRPPSTYTPSGQPYTPPQAEAPGAPPPPNATAAAAPPASPDPTDNMPYPKQTLFDAISGR